MNRRRTVSLAIPIVMCLFVFSSLYVLAGSTAGASGLTRRVATTGLDTGDCTEPDPPCRTVQYAVDAAGDGDLIKVATGIYTGVQAGPAPPGYDDAPVITQVVFISKTVIVRGGYTTTNAFAGPSDPVANPTTLDAGGKGRVLFIAAPTPGALISPTIEGLRIAGGDATGLGGGLGSKDAGGGVWVSEAAVTISNCAVYSNTASTGSAPSQGHGGGLFLVDSHAMLNGNRVFGNTGSTASQGNGGGLHFWRGTATLSGNTVVSNTASLSSYGHGGGLYFFQCAARLDDNTVVSNTATTSSGEFDRGRGGGLYLNDTGATLTGNTIAGNVASMAWQGHGGGLFLYDDNAILSQNTVQGNRAGRASYSSGGGLYLTLSDATLDGNTVVSNTASTSAGISDYAFGGGLAVEQSAATLSGNLVLSNTASVAGWGSGGGLYFNNSGGSIVAGNVVRGNRASLGRSGRGGGLYFVSSDASVTGNTVVRNTANTSSLSGVNGEGGGLYLAAGSYTLSGNEIISNTATRSPNSLSHGGGVYVYAGGSYTFTNNVVAGNHAYKEGGGLSFGGTTGAPTFARLRHTTIADNTGSSSGGQGVHAAILASLSFTNTIIAGHRNVALYASAGSTTTLQATLWYDNASDTGGLGHVVTGTIDVRGSPGFVDPSTWDYHLTSASAAIDEGVDAGVTVDMDGKLRPTLLGYDIGADEFWPRQIHLPLVLRGG